jgi:hypothetical protein
MSAVKDFRFASDGRKPISDAGLEGIRVPGSYGPHPCQELHGSLGIVLPGDLRRRWSEHASGSRGPQPPKGKRRRTQYSAIELQETLDVRIQLFHKSLSIIDDAL